MRPDPIRTLVIGLGRHARRSIVTAIVGARSWELAGIVSSHAARDEWNVPIGVDLDAVLSDAQPEAVYVATVPSEHERNCVEAIKAGIHLVICEKPLATTRVGVDAILDVARAHNAIVVEALAYRHHPQWHKISELIASDALSEIRHAYARFSYPRLPQQDHRNSVAKGGGALLDAGIYPISLALTLLGSDVEVASGMSGTPGDVDTVGWATFVDKERRTAQVSWEMGSSYSNVMRIVGRTGSIEVARPFSKPAEYAEPIILTGPTGEHSQVAYQRADQFAAMLDDIATMHADPHWRAATERDIMNRWTVMDQIVREASLSRPRETGR